jgi:hypothetical protein
MPEIESEPSDAGVSFIPSIGLFCDTTMPYNKEYYPLGYPVRIATNHADVLMAADESFGHAKPSGRASGLRVQVEVTGQQNGSSPPEPARHAANNLFSLFADRENQALLNLRSLANFTRVTESTLKNRLYFRTNFLEKVVYLLLGSSVVTDLHAACISRNGMGILLCGASGAGKSTLAYACAREGWNYTSDDTSYLINDSKSPRVVGHSHRARFRPEARELFPELAEHPISPRMEGKASIEVPIVELPVRCTSSEADIRAIVFLKRLQSSAAKLLRLPPGVAINRMQEELYSSGEIRTRHKEKLKVFGNIQAFDLQYCDLRQGIEALEDLTLRL